MAEYLPLVLVLGVLITGLIWLVDAICFAKKRRELVALKQEDVKLPVIVEYSKSFFPVLLIVLVIRSFIVQPYVVPTGSLEPTILPGDFIVVSQFSYGIRLPVLNKKVINVGEPKVGDIALFHWPVNPNVLFIKRVIGTPGDHVVYKDKVLTINGKVATQKLIGPTNLPDSMYAGTVDKVQEDLNGVKHDILVHAKGGITQDFDITVPKGEYFMMGDNRDESDDSRFWGFVPESDLVGKGLMIWMSWDKQDHNVRWSRIGTAL